MFLKKIYASIPYILLPLSIFVMLILFLLGRITLLINSLLVLLPCIVGSLYFIFLNKKKIRFTMGYTDKYQLLIPQNRIRHLFLIAAIAIFILLIISDYTSPLFLILIMILYLLCIIQIISKDTSVGFAIFSLSYTTAVFLLPLFLTNSYYYDGSDVIFHTNGILSIINSGVVPSTDISNVYGLFYGMYLFIGSAAKLSGFAAHTSLYVFLTLAQLGTSIFIYLISKQYFKSTKIGLFATYFYLVLSFIFSGILTMAPYFFLSLLCIMIIYLTVRKINKYTMRHYIIAIPIIAFSIISHHANHIPMMLILLSLVIFDIFIIIEGRFYKKIVHHTINIHVVIIYFITIGAYLYYTYVSSAFYFIINALKVGDEFTISSLSAITESQHADVLITFRDSFYVSICVFTILIALCYIINSKKCTKHQYLFVLFILVFFILFIPGPTTSLPILGSLELYRWRGILLAFFSIAIAVGLVIVAQNTFKTKHYKIFSTIVVLVISLSLIYTPIIYISADNTLLDTIGIDKIHTNPKNAANNHFSDHEMAMIYVFSEKLSASKNIATDYEMGRYLATYINPNVIGPSLNNLFEHTTSQSEIDQSYSTILFRKAHFDYCGFWFSLGQRVDADNRVIQIESNAETNAIFNKNVHLHNCIYQNGEDIVYNR